MAASDARPVPLKNQINRIYFFVFDEDGDLVPGATFDSGLASGSGKARIRGDGGAAANSTNSVAEIGDGEYYVDLTAAESNFDHVSGIARVTAPATAKSTPISIYPKENGDLVTTLEIENAVWNAARASHTTGGTFGERVVANVDQWRGTQPNTLVSGRVDASVGAMANDVLTAAALAADAVTEMRSLVSGTADSGSTTTLVDAARTEADADYWKGCWFLFTSGSLFGQVRLITAFDQATDTFTFAPATTQAVSTHNYEILPAGAVDVRLWKGALPNDLISGRVDANAQVVGDKTGYALSSVGVQAIWDALTSAMTTSGSIGKRIVDFLTGDIYARLGAPAGASVSADIAAVKSDTGAIKTKTDQLVFTAANKVDASVRDWKGATPNDLISGRVDANAQVVGDKTGYTLSSAGVQAIWDALSSALTTAGSIGKRLVDFITGDTFGRLGAPAGASIAADIAAVKADTSGIAAIQNNTRCVRVVPAVLERPDTSSIVYRIELLLYDEVGNMEAPDAAPTISVVNQAGTSRDANLDSTTMSNVSTGRYRSTYTVASTHEIEQLVVAFSVVEGGVTRVFANATLVVDAVAVDFTAADRAKLDTLHDTRLTASRAANLDEITAGRLGKLDTLTFVSGRVDASVGHMQNDTLSAAALSAAAVSEIQVGLAQAGDLTAVKNKTDQLVFTTAGRVDASVRDWKGAVPNDLIAGRVDSSATVTDKTGYELTAGERAAIANALLDLSGAIDGYTLREIQRVMAAMLAGLVTGGPHNPSFQKIGGGKVRVTMLATPAGNRTVVVIDATP